MTKRKSLIAVFAFALVLSLALFFGITLSGGTLTAQAASSDATILSANENPSKVSVTIGANTINLDSGDYVKTNTSTEENSGATTEPTTYVAWYHNGILKLRGYNGGKIVTGGLNAVDTTIELVGLNTVDINDSNEIIGISHSGGGNLSILGDSNSQLKISVRGNKSTYGIATNISNAGSSDGNIIICGDTTIGIDSTTSATSGYAVYGIYAPGGVFVKDNSTLNVTCHTSVTSSSAGFQGSCILSKKTTIDTTKNVMLNFVDAPSSSYAVGSYSGKSDVVLTKGSLQMEWMAQYYYDDPWIASSFNGNDSNKYAERKCIDTNNKKGIAVYTAGTPFELTMVGLFDANLNNYGYKYCAGELVTVKASSRIALSLLGCASNDIDTITNNGDGTYSFEMPNKASTITALYDAFAEQPTFTVNRQSNYIEGIVSFRLKGIPESLCIVGENDDTKCNNVTFNGSGTNQRTAEFLSDNIVAGKYRIKAVFGTGGSATACYSDTFEVDYTDKTPFAEVSNVIVNGKTGREITPVNFDVTLTYATFKAIAEGTDVSSWFSSFPTGLIAKISAVSEGATRATIAISGTPTAIANRAIYLNIPKEFLATGNDIAITTEYNSGANFRIVEPVSYTITMTDGKAQVGDKTLTNIEEGLTVTIIANDRDDYVFDKWIVVSGSVALADENNIETTFVMPESAVEIKATYKEIVNSVEVFVTAPVKDNTADTTTMSVNSTGYSATKVEWYKGEGVVSSMQMSATDKFVAGQSYTVVVTIKLNSGYVFAGDSTLGKSINRQAATLNSGSGTDTITIKTTFTVPTDPIPEHSVTVENGTLESGATTGNFAEGSSVTVSANAPASDMMFDKWTATGITLTSEQLSSQTFTFTMGTNDVTLTATYKAIPKYTVTVIDGKLTGGATSGSFKAGESITITVDAKEGFTFDKWTATGITLTTEQLSSATITITVGTKDITLTATYKPIPKYTVTVVDGKLADDTTSGSFKAGESVTITADAKEGFVFDKWTAEGITLTSEQLSSPTITITVGANSITLTATYTEVVVPGQKYKVTVENGSADGDEFKMGQVVTITADTAPEGKEFDKWVVVYGDVTIANINNAKTTFIMPSKDVEVKATYKDKVPSGGGTDKPGGEITPTPDKKDGLSGGAIAGIVVGSVAVVGIGGFAIFWFVVNKKSFTELIAAIKGLFKKK